MLKLIDHVDGLAIYIQPSKVAAIYESAGGKGCNVNLGDCYARASESAAEVARMVDEALGVKISCEHCGSPLMGMHQMWCPKVGGKGREAAAENMFRSLDHGDEKLYEALKAADDGKIVQVGDA